eukprot:jgi/Psemu1/54058/gm1.54058_g
MKQYNNTAQQARIRQNQPLTPNLSRNKIKADPDYVKVKANKDSPGLYKLVAKLLWNKTCTIDHVLASHVELVYAIPRLLSRRRNTINSGVFFDTIPLQEEAVQEKRLMGLEVQTLLQAHLKYLYSIVFLGRAGHCFEERQRELNNNYTKGTGDHIPWTVDDSYALLQNYKGSKHFNQSQMKKKQSNQEPKFNDNANSKARHPEHSFQQQDFSWAHWLPIKIKCYRCGREEHISPKCQETEHALGNKSLPQRDQAQQHTSVSVKEFDMAQQELEQDKMELVYRFAHMGYTSMQDEIEPVYVEDIAIVDTVGELPGVGTVWVHENGIANILLFHKLLDTNNFEINYTSRPDNCRVWNKSFQNETPDGVQRQFQPDSQGLYYLDCTTEFRAGKSNSISRTRVVNTESTLITNPAELMTLVTNLMIETVGSNKENFTNCGTQLAKAIWRFQHVAGHSSDKTLINMTTNIYGIKDKNTYRSMKDKNTYQKKVIVKTPKQVPLPETIEEQYCKNVTIGADILFVNQKPILATIKGHPLWDLPCSAIHATQQH